MIRFRILLLLFPLCLLLSACGGSDEADAVAEAPDPAGAEYEGNNPIANANETMRQVTDRIRGGGEGSREVIDFRNLKEVLPERLLKMDRVSHEGQKSGFGGLSFSMAEAQYEGSEGQELEVTVVDASSVGFAQMGALWATAEIDRESEDEVERTTTVDGHRAFYKYNKRSQTGSLSVLNNDLIITLEGSGIGEKDLEEAYEDLKLGGLPGF